jgi:hypothetical protein
MESAVDSRDEGRLHAVNCSHATYSFTHHSLVCAVMERFEITGELDSSQSHILPLPPQGIKPVR